MVTSEQQPGRKLHSYPKIYNLGHVVIKDLLTVPIVIQEKVDGSQFSFGLVDGKLKAKSKKAEINLDTPNGMFEKAVDVIREMKPKLKEGWVYRCEYLQKPKHNVLAYDRVPKNYLVLYDIDTGKESYVDRALLVHTARDLNIDVIPELEVFTKPLHHVIEDNPIEYFNILLNTESFLGGQKIEGIVIKQYMLFGKDDKLLFGKHVSERFKEVHRKDWKEPTKGDVIVELGNKYCTTARWDKAVIHLKEQGKLEDSPTDIRALIKEVQTDFTEECKEEIKEDLWKHFKQQLTKRAVKGLPEWYKQKLLKAQFGE
jgi:hypothetical protein